MNQYAARAHRHDFVEQIRSKLFDYFSENPKDIKLLTDMADEEAEATDATYVAKTCNQYELPCLDYTVNAPDHE